eukprot:TRINITY_DN8953_c0_g1_i2.p1 TRINITY_DN8953_c0_g1~~TRINITY_DN8953_c0_g1_i2.p1  ORF type:complete len:539 (-),score=84.19 TRINITY_DN8953_c0_g1_i2:165-1781(-)
MYEHTADPQAAMGASSEHGRAQGDWIWMQAPNAMGGGNLLHGQMHNPGLAHQPDLNYAWQEEELRHASTSLTSSSLIACPVAEHGGNLFHGQMHNPVMAHQPDFHYAWREEELRDANTSLASASLIACPVAEHGGNLFHGQMHNPVMAHQPDFHYAWREEELRDANTSLASSSLITCPVAEQGGSILHGQTHSQVMADQPHFHYAWGEEELRDANTSLASSSLITCPVAEQGGMAHQPDFHYAWREEELRDANPPLASASLIACPVAEQREHGGPWALQQSICFSGGSDLHRDLCSNSSATQTAPEQQRSCCSGDSLKHQVNSKKFRFGVLYWGAGNDGWDLTRRGAAPWICDHCNDLVDSWRGRFDNAQVTLRMCASEGAGFKDYVQDFLMLSVKASFALNLQNFYRWSVQQKKKVLTERIVLGSLLEASQRRLKGKTGIDVSNSWQRTLRDLAGQYRKKADEINCKFVALLLDAQGCEMQVADMLRRTGSCPIGRVLVILGGPEGIPDAYAQELLSILSEYTDFMPLRCAAPCQEV